jgi:branched-chain amino acid transport system ATP-binding protein
VTFGLHHVTAGYGETVVIRDVTVVVPTASVVALIGPNGAGKTTLLRAASGLLRPRTGTIVVDGEDHTGDTSFQLAAAGLCHIPEGRGVFASLTVRENLVLHARAGAEDDGVERAVDAFPTLGNRLSQVAGTMSGGEQQMLAVARAYVCRPRIVLLDEVSMGLAPMVVDVIFESLVRLAAEGAALLLVEQYVTRALEMAGYVYVLNRGRVTFAGEPSELEGEDVFAEYLGIDVGAS